MDLARVMGYLNSEDGPNIPLYTIAAYCGTDASSISRYIHGKQCPREGMREQLEKGLRELAWEIADEVGIIGVRR